MEVYLNVAETGIGTYGANAGAERYFGHDASALSSTEAARIAAVLPLPKKRGAVAPKGFTRRYGNTIAARIGQVRRDGLDACIYKGATAPKDKTPPPSKASRQQPGEEYETATPPPPEASVDTTPINEAAPDEVLQPDVAAPQPEPAPDTNGVIHEAPPISDEEPTNPPPPEPQA
jgi:monofunctional glycosyltransferase